MFLSCHLRISEWIYIAWMSKRDIWSLSGSNGIQLTNYLFNFHNAASMAKHF